MVNPALTGHLPAFFRILDPELEKQSKTIGFWSRLERVNGFKVDVKGLTLAYHTSGLN